MSQKESVTLEPLFTRGEVARVLNVTPLTIANREKAKKYPEPRRDLNNYRVYSLNDVLNLQLITYSRLDPPPIIAVLHEKGIEDMKLIGRIMDKALSKRTGA